MSYYSSVVLAQSPSFPSPESFYQEVNSVAMPQILGIGTACLGVILAILLIRSIRNV